MTQFLSPCIERILGYTILTGKCAECESSQVVVRVHSVRQYESHSIMSGEVSLDYCEQHKPAWLVRDLEEWKQVLTTPPDSESR